MRTWRRRGLAALPRASAASAGAINTDPINANAVGTEYVALGDSFAAGPLILPQVQLDPCTRSGVDYPHLIAQALHVTTFRDVTCSNATTGDMTAPQSATLPTDPAAPPQLDALTDSTTLVTLAQVLEG